jgi:hypothetical protein
MKTIAKISRRPRGGQVAAVAAIIAGMTAGGLSLAAPAHAQQTTTQTTTTYSDSYQSGPYYSEPAPVYDQEEAYVPPPPPAPVYVAPAPGIAIDVPFVGVRLGF